MNNYTSIYVDSNLFDKITSASIHLNISTDTIIKNILFLTSSKFNCNTINGCLTKYQDHKPASWERMYFHLNTEEIEILGKFRQKFKISISKLLFIGFLFFWDLIMFQYKERLLIKKKINNNSYEKFKQKYSPLILKYKNLYKIIQKE